MKSLIVTLLTLDKLWQRCLLRSPKDRVICRAAGLILSDIRWQVEKTRRSKDSLLHVRPLNIAEAWLDETQWTLLRGLIRNDLSTAPTVYSQINQLKPLRKASLNWRLRLNEFYQDTNTESHKINISLLESGRDDLRKRLYVIALTPQQLSVLRRIRGRMILGSCPSLELNLKMVRSVYLQGAAGLLNYIAETHILNRDYTHKDIPYSKAMKEANFTSRKKSLINDLLGVFRKSELVTLGFN